MMAAPTKSAPLGTARASEEVEALRALRDAGEGPALRLRAVYALRELPDHARRATCVHSVGVVST